MFDTATDREITARLINWGLWNNTNCYPNLGYPAFVEIMSEYFPSATRINPNEIDAQHIEDVISSLDLAGRGGIGWGEIWAFVCRLEYIEFERPRSAKAEHVRLKYKRPCSTRTFRYHLYNAKRAIHIFSDPIHCKI